MKATTAMIDPTPTTTTTVYIACCPCFYSY